MSLDNGLIAYYKLNTDSKDSVGSNHGISSDILYDNLRAIFPYSTSSIVFNGSYQFTSNDYTLSFWCKISSVASTSSIFAGYNSSSEIVFFFLYDADGLRLRFHEGSSWIDLPYIDMSSYFNTTINLQLVHTSSSYLIYINGALKQTYNSPSYSQVVSTYKTHLTTNGEMSNVRFYYDAKNQAFIDELYAEGAYRQITLKDVDSSNGVLVCMGTDGYAVSKSIVKPSNYVDIQMHDAVSKVVVKDVLIDDEDIIINKNINVNISSLPPVSVVVSNILSVDDDSNIERQTDATPFTNALDGDDNTMWETSVATTPHLITYSSDKVFIPRKFTWRSGSYNYYVPRYYRLQASKDKKSWTTLYTSDQVDLPTNTTRTINLNNTGNNAYKYFRMYVEKMTYNNSNQKMQLKRFELECDTYEYDVSSVTADTVTTTYRTIDEVVDIEDIVNSPVDKVYSDTSLDVGTEMIVNTIHGYGSKYTVSQVDDVLKQQTVIPYMTSNSNAVCTVSDSSGSTNTYKALDNNHGTYWDSVSNVPATIFFEFAVPTMVSQIYFKHGPTNQYNPKSWILYGSHDNSTWIKLYEVDFGPDGGANTQVTKNLNNVDTYKYYKFYVSKVSFNNNYPLKLYTLELRDNLFWKYSYDVSSITVGTKPIGFKQYMDTPAVKRFSSVSNTVGKFEFANISISVDPDMLITSENIKDGDKLVIVKDDDSTNEVVASDITPQEYRYKWITVGSDIVLSNNDYTVSSPTTSHVNSQCYTELISNSFTVKITTTDNNLHSVVGISTINTKQDSYFCSVPTGYGFDLSNGKKHNNGVAIQTGYVPKKNDVIYMYYDYDTGKFDISINNSPSFNLYTLEPNTSVYIASSEYFENTELTNELYYVYTMDTSAITNGEVPSRVFRVDEKVLFNSVETNTINSQYSFYDVAEGQILGDNSVVAHFPFEYSMENTVGNNGWNGSGPHSYVDGIVGKCLSLPNGSNMRCGKMDYGENFSYTLWIYLEDSTNYDRRIVDNNSNSARCALLIKKSGTGVPGILSFQLYGIKELGYNPPLKTWIHIGISVNSKNITLYVNGTLHGTTVDSAGRSLNNSMTIGTRYFDTGEGFNGKIDDFRVYNKSISAEEVRIAYEHRGVKMLKTESMFKNTDITPSTEFKTKVQMSATGNKMTQLDFDIMKEP